KVLSFRSDHSELLSRGNRTTIAGSDADEWLIVERSHQDEFVYLGFNVAEEAKNITLRVSDHEAEVTDHYSGETYQATENEAGEFVVTISVPELADGGTVLLTVENGSILPGEAEDNQQEVPAGFFRLHFAGLDADEIDQLGLWLWDDVAGPSDNWPLGAISFSDAIQTDFGHYLDFELASQANQIGFLI